MCAHEDVLLTAAFRRSILTLETLWQTQRRSFPFVHCPVEFGGMHGYTLPKYDV